MIRYKYDTTPIRWYGKILKFKIWYDYDTLVKKIKFKLHIKTQNTKYGLKIKSKKISAKPRPNRHRKTIRHNNEIAFTQRNNNIVLKQKKRHKTDGDNNWNMNVSNIDNKESDN